MAEELLQDVVLPADKKMVGELELDVVATRFFHAFSQVNIIILFLFFLFYFFALGSISLRFLFFVGSGVGFLSR